MLIQKFRNAFGIVLFSGKKKRIEAWYFPKNFIIEPHIHPNQNIEVILLFFGYAEFYRKKDPLNKPLEVDKYITKIPSSLFKQLSIPAKAEHWFFNKYFPLIVINISTFLNNFKPISAANDFQIIT